MYDNGIKPLVNISAKKVASPVDVSNNSTSTRFSVGEESNMINKLVNQIARKKTDLVSGGSNRRLQDAESILRAQGLRQIKEDAFIKIAAKVQWYIDLSLKLRKEHLEFEGLPPTELAAKEDGELVPTGAKTEAIDQQRQLYAAARSALIDPAYGDQIMGDLVEWHDAFVSHFVIDQGGPTVRARVHFGTDTKSQDPPDPKANLRLTYAVQGSATLVKALLEAAERCSNTQQSRLFRDRAKEIALLSLAIGEKFYKDYADLKCPGRYFLYPRGAHGIEALVGLSHNNSQSYLIEGMAALAELDSKQWQQRLLELLAFIKTQRDPASGLLHEFDFASKGEGFLPDAINQTEFKWQVQEGHETIILGHTLAGLFVWPAKLIADNVPSHDQMPTLVEDFVQTMNRIGGIKAHGFPANAFQLIPGSTPPFKPMPWPEGAWQAELLWQFLLHADRAGIDLSTFEVQAEKATLTLDRVFARGIAFHDERLFNGISYLIENNGRPLQGREATAPINHAADTLRDLTTNLEA